MGILQYLIVEALQNKTLISVVRKTFPALRTSALRDFKEIINNLGLWDDDRYMATEHTYTFDNGSVIEFFSVDSAEKLKGLRRDINAINKNKMTTKQMMDIFYKEGSKGPLPLDLSSLEKYMLTHTFFDGLCIAKGTKEPTIPTIVEPIKPVFVEPIKPVFVEPPKPPIETIKPPIIVEPPTEPTKTPIRTRFRSYLKDSLFWCMYVHSHGFTAFETTKAIGTNMLNLMMTEKRALFDFFNKDENKTALKNINHKITNVKINEIKCDLMTKPMLTSIEALIPCCVYWNCPIYYKLVYPLPGN
jgi:hypothetical protein